MTAWTWFSVLWGVPFKGYVEGPPESKETVIPLDEVLCEAI